MALSDPTQKLPKIPFLVGDAALLAAAWLIVDRAGRPMSVESMLAIVACVATGSILGVIPWIADYARSQDEALDDRQRSLEAIARTVSGAAEQIGIVATGFNEIAELERKNLKHAEQVSHKLEERAAKAAAVPATVGQVAEPAQKAQSRQPKPKPEPPAEAPVVSAPAAVGQVGDLAYKKQSRPAEEKPANATPEPPPAPEPKPESEPKATNGAVPHPEAAETAPRAPRKIRAQPQRPAPKPAEAKIAEPDLGLDEAIAKTDAPKEEAPVPPAEAPADDGATRLLVTAYIGIGNRLFIRGAGPGLSWDKGTPLQFVSIGKWRWETSNASAPVEFKLFKNDESECAELGKQRLEPGHQVELTAKF